MAYINFNPKDYFKTKLYSGNGSTNAITGVGFQPDLVWLKSRSDITNYQLYDVTRGVQKKATLSSNAPATETNGLQSFDSDGFTLGLEYDVNNSGSNYISWNWLANGTGVSNTDGSITSTVSVSTTSGFSVVTYTGTGSSGATVGHGLGSAPSFITVKRIDAVGDWWSYHKSSGATKYYKLNTSDPKGTGSTIWNDTAPTSSVFTLGNYGEVNASGGTYVAYCFAEKKGFSRFGEYLGTGSATYASFNYCGFKPSFVMVKLGTGTDSWFISDTARATYNPSQQYMRPNETSAEGTSSAHKIDLLSNGFKIRSADTAYNTLSADYIYMAFAEHPLVSSTGTPCTAR